MIIKRNVRVKYQMKRSTWPRRSLMSLKSCLERPWSACWNLMWVTCVEPEQFYICKSQTYFLICILLFSYSRTGKKCPSVLASLDFNKGLMINFKPNIWLACWKEMCLIFWKLLFQLSFRRRKGQNFEHISLKKKKKSFFLLEIPSHIFIKFHHTFCCLRNEC